jgi:hypothetical protein
MYVRMARFEGVDTERSEADIEEFRRMVRAQERPVWMPEDVFTTLRDGVKRVLTMIDREAGVSIDLTFTETALAAREVHEALDSLSPPDGLGRRASVQTFELLMDEQMD